jgi:hypothetical protein
LIGLFFVQDGWEKETVSPEINVTLFIGVHLTLFVNCFVLTFLLMLLLFGFSPVNLLTTSSVLRASLAASSFERNDGFVRLFSNYCALQLH